MNIAIILAGGKGTRVGANIPKQFINVLGKPVIAYTIEKFQDHREIDAIEVVCLENYIEEMENIKVKYSFSKIKWITKGGQNFQESVYNGIKNLKNEVDKNDIVIIHFAASPFVEDYIISDCIRKCKIYKNAISTTDFFVLSGLKEKNTSVDDEENYSKTYINRDTVACMSTPHAFNYKYISDLYEKAINSGIIYEVEPHTTTLMYKMNQKIYFSKGSQTNIKITKQEDLDLFEGYIMMKQNKLIKKRKEK